jgi:hypothetical protein
MLSFIISYPDLIKTSLFWGTSLKEGIGGWKEAQRQGEDRMTIKEKLYYIYLPIWVYLHNITPPLKVLLTYGKRRVNTGSKYKEEECSLNARHTQLFGSCVYIPIGSLIHVCRGKSFRSILLMLPCPQQRKKPYKILQKSTPFWWDVIFWSAMNYVPWAHQRPICGKL